MTISHPKANAIDFFPLPVRVRLGERIVDAELNRYVKRVSRRCGRYTLADVTLPSGNRVNVALTNLIEEVW